MIKIFRNFFLELTRRAPGHCIIQFSLERELETGVFHSRNASKAVSCIISKDKDLSFRCSTEHQSKEWFGKRINFLKLF